MRHPGIGTDEAATSRGAAPLLAMTVKAWVSLGAERRLDGAREPAYPLAAFDRRDP
ncbi:MAG: hypothetical protein ACREFN_11500 [Acetobacteraceae bacterium]